MTVKRKPLTIKQKKKVQKLLKDYIAKNPGMSQMEIKQKYAIFASEVRRHKK